MPEVIQLKIGSIVEVDNKTYIVTMNKKKIDQYTGKPTAELKHWSLDQSITE